MKKVTETVRELALPVVEENGCKLWDVEYVREAGQWYLRIYIDKDGGVNILDCEAISRALSDILGRGRPHRVELHFRVASAGAERPLKRPGDFEQFMGSPVLLKTYKPWTGARNFPVTSRATTTARSHFASAKRKSALKRTRSRSCACAATFNQKEYQLL